MAQEWMAAAQTWLHEHDGVLPISTLVGFGCTRRDAYRLVDDGQFALVMPGVLRSKHWPLGKAQLMMAACLRNPSAVLCTWTAARMWGLRSLPTHQDEVVHVVVPAGCSPELPGVIVHRSRQLTTTDIVRRDDGLRLTSPTRTLFDLADDLGAQRTSSIFEQLVNEQRGTVATHAATVARVGHPGRSRTRTMRAVIASRPAWRRAVQSELEHRILAEIRAQSLPEPVVQHRVRKPDGTWARFDFAWPVLGVALEVDHPFWHAWATESHRDKHRDLVMATVGWQTLRITDLDVNGGLVQSIRNVAVVLALRS